MRVQGKVVVVTGGANGIGRALCVRFHEQGARGIVVADLDGEAAERLAADIGGLAVRTDVSREADIKSLVRHSRDAYGAIDLFCSNAGVVYEDGPGGTAASTPNDLWDKAWRINVLAHVFAVRACLPHMRKAGNGYFLITASAAGLLSQIGSASYSTTKHAAIGFAESVAITHGDEGIGVSVLCPQAVDTSMIAGFAGGGVAGIDGVLSPKEVAEVAVRGLAEERFLILPHPKVETYFQRKTADYDRWLNGMRRLRRQFN